MAMTPREMIEVLQHFVDGGMIEFRSTIVDDDDYLIWQDAVVPTWNFDDFDYRIKPKPLELWAVVMDVGDVLGVFNSNTRAHAFRDAAEIGRVIKVSEVMGD